jgi:hypothetical protein
MNKESRRAFGRAARSRGVTGELEQLLAAGGTRGGYRRRRRDMARRGKSQQGSGEWRAGELEVQVVWVEWQGAAGSPGDGRRGVAGGVAEQQRGRG